MNNCCKSASNPTVGVTQNQPRSQTQTPTQPQPQACAPADSQRTFQPVVDIVESADHFTLTADIPGANPGEIDANFDEGVLTLRAPAPARQPDGTRWLVREYGVGTWERSFRIGEGIDSSRIEAAVKDGVLTLTLPKSANARSRKIDVRAN